MDTERDKDQILKIVDRLCDDYKSHGYQISRREAKKIGMKVTDADPETETILIDLLKFYNSRPVGPFGQVESGQTVKTHIAWIDSLKLKCRAEQSLMVGSKNEMNPLGDQWSPY